MKPKRTFWEPVVRRCTSCNGANCDQLVKIEHNKRVIRAWRCNDCGAGQGGEPRPQPHYKRLAVFYHVDKEPLVARAKLLALGDGESFATRVMTLIEEWVASKERQDGPGRSEGGGTHPEDGLSS